MTNLIILQTIIDINKRIDEELEFYNEQLKKTELRLTILREEQRQLLELINILEQEKNK